MNYLSRLTWINVHFSFFQDFEERERGRVVIYFTTLGVVRETWARCVKIRQILRNLLIKVDERDVFMCRENQIEVMERLNSLEVSLPQVFVDGHYIGVSGTFLTTVLVQCPKSRKMLWKLSKIWIWTNIERLIIQFCKISGDIYQIDSLDFGHCTSVFFFQFFFFGKRLVPLFVVFRTLIFYEFFFCITNTVCQVLEKKPI